MEGGFTEPAKYLRTANETLCPSRAGNSFALTFVTLKAVGALDSTTDLTPVYVTKLPSTLVTLGGAQSRW